MGSAHLLIAAKNTSKGLNYLQNVSHLRRDEAVEMDEQGLAITVLLLEAMVCRERVLVIIVGSMRKPGGSAGKKLGGCR